MPDDLDESLDPGNFDDPEAFEEALAAYRARVPMIDPEWRALEAEVRERAWWVAGAAQADLVQQVFDAIDSAIENGTAFADFKSDVGDELSAAWQGTVANPAARLATVFRTNLMTAYNAGRYAQNTHPAVAKHLPIWRFDDITDNRECPICRACHGVMLQSDDPWWKTHHSPLHHQCRCIQTAMTTEDADEEGGPDDEGPDVDADDGFGRAPSLLAWEPSVADYSDDIRPVLEDRLKNVGNL